jgi:hypothetical protein
MHKYIVSLRTACSYDYEIEASSEREAIEKAKDQHASESAEENLKHMYDFNWRECDVSKENDHA